jgi:uncharacterized protein (DUF362 family)/Pyruvate/2-oxoacid:ferredoxin oxidoreductase delta subunit
MPTVILKQSSYDYGPLREQVFEIMDLLGGRGIGKGSRVILKPNLLTAAPPSSAVITHPFVVRAAAEYVLAKGGRPVVADSPAMGSFAGILKESGISAALRGMDVECRPFKRPALMDIGEPFGRIELAADIFEADAVINLPKLKTHAFMLLTLGVKNLFGCVVDFKKPEWHMKLGQERELFARLLVQICRTVRPRITILDGILAMEGNGPGKGGTPREVGLLAASEDPFCLDAEVSRLVGLDPEKLPTHRAAAGPGAVPPYAVQGEIPLVHDFRIPQAGPQLTGPGPLNRMVKRHLLQNPLVDRSLCSRCGKCLEVCPARAVSDEKEIRFDLQKCIRCFCCIEVCPQGAISVSESRTRKAVRKLLRGRL